MPLRKAEQKPGPSKNYRSPATLRRLMRPSKRQAQHGLLNNGLTGVRRGLLNYRSTAAHHHAQLNCTFTGSEDAYSTTSLYHGLPLPNGVYHGVTSPVMAFTEGFLQTCWPNILLLRAKLLSLSAEWSRSARWNKTLLGECSRPRDSAAGQHLLDKPTKTLSKIHWCRMRWCWGCNRTPQVLSWWKSGQNSIRSGKNI